MTIADVREKCKNALQTLPRDVLIISILILSSLASFGFGYLAGLDSVQTATVLIDTSAANSSALTGQVFASKNGTTYYTPGCPGADRIIEANKLWFTSPDAARAAGYTAATHCGGM